MSLFLHGHHILIIATIAFVVAVLLPYWYTSSNDNMKRNIFQICDQINNRCYWTLIPTQGNQSIQTILPIVAASSAIACVGTSLFALICGSWFLQRFTNDNRSKWLLILTIFFVFISFLFSCGVWSILLTTNLYQHDSYIKYVRLEDFDFAFWINIGASSGYFYGLIIYLLGLCQIS